MTSDNKGKLSDATRVVHAGRPRSLTGRFVNPPVVHASTVLFASTEEMVSGKAEYTYARRGTPTSVALEMAITELCGAAGTALCPSGLSALTTAILPFVAAGDHVLLPDSCYGPLRHFADTVLAQFGVTTTYYDPTIGAGVAALMTPRTRVVHVESPGSNTFEMQDLPAIAAVAHAAGAVVTVDDTWATPLFCQPLSKGADVMVLSATKYIGGHADLMMGTVSANAEHWPKVKHLHGAMGTCTAPDDVYLALRGLRTMSVRLERHMTSTLTVASWLEQHADVARVHYPALPSDPGHAIWRRDMTGASGLFAFVLNGWSFERTCAFLNGLTLFGQGFSWGGFESLAILASHGLTRTAKAFAAAGPLIRVHIGLDDPADLIADLEQSLTAAAG